MVDSPDDTVTEALKEAILRGDYAPRQRLIEAELCERFAASRFTVRAALQRLAGAGLVEFQRHRSAQVREISIDEAIEITEIRRLLEGMEAARAAERVTRTDITDLRRIERDMRTAVGKADLLRYSELNATLHRRIREIAAHETASRILGQLRDQTVRHQFTLALVPGRPRVSLPQHEAIIEAIIHRDGKAAERHMHQHLDSVIAALKALAVASGQTRPGQGG